MKNAVACLVVALGLTVNTPAKAGREHQSV